MTRLDWIGVAVMVGWFLLAGYVLVALARDADQALVVLAAWCGGVLSVYAVQLLARLGRVDGRLSLARER